MAHGSKKWIVAYDGHIKRSNDRTKKDYYRGLKWWEEPYRWHRFSPSKKDTFCPQCRHVAKAVLAIEEENKRIRDFYRIEYDRIFGEAEAIWKAYDSEFYQHWTGLYMERRKPRVEKPPRFYDWLYEQKDVDSGNWQFDERNFLCFKHERMLELKHEMWDCNLHGKKDSYQYTVRQENVCYRNEVKNLMQKAKYDEDYYDDIPPKKVRGWLD